MPLYLLTKPASDLWPVYDQARAALVTAATPAAALAAADAMMTAQVAAQRPFRNFTAVEVAATAGAGHVNTYFTRRGGDGDGPAT